MVTPVRKIHNVVRKAHLRTPVRDVTRPRGEQAISKWGCAVSTQVIRAVVSSCFRIVYDGLGATICRVYGRRIAIWRPRSESCCKVANETRDSIDTSQPSAFPLKNRRD